MAESRKDKSKNDRVLASVILCSAAAVVGFGGSYIADSGKKPVEVEIISAAETESTILYEDGLTVDDVIGNTVKKERVTTAAAEELIMVNINTAGAEELEKLNGVGEKIAASIIEYRENTPFEKPEDIMNVSGIGEKKYEKIKDNICV